MNGKPNKGTSKTMKTENVLIEIGTEELPPKSLSQLGSSFAEQVETELNQLNLTYQDVNWLASPRRLAVVISALVEQQPDEIIEKRGPSIAVAFDEQGQPTKAAVGWARGNGISIDQAERLETAKGVWLLHKARKEGKKVAELLPETIQRALHRLPIPKAMRWGAGSTQFIRPVHTVTIFYGAQPIAAEILGVTASDQIYGHRFHHPEMLTLTHADHYQQQLLQAYVMVDHHQRKETIAQQVQQVATQLQGVAVMDPGLLDEVAALVEWPVILVGSFDPVFLAVPAEALIYTMQDNQKYFPVLDEQGKLMPKFIFVSNIHSKEPHQVIAGNEKVIRPRLADAQFFFETDKQQSLESRLASLETVLFQNKLGTLAEKSQRISLLAAYIAKQLEADAQLAQRAGLLSKTDLMTDMVIEFPGIQGIMGMYYARHDGEPELVAQALNEQYQPRFAGDKLPTNPISCALAIADKIDTLVGIFGIGLLPKADKDPFALRRAAIGVLRIIVDADLDLDLTDLVAYSQQLYGDKLMVKELESQVVDFVLGRFRAWYQEQGIEVDVIRAVLALRPTKPADFEKRIQAVRHFMTLDGAENLCAANKRVANILAKLPAGSEIPSEVAPALLQDEQEIRLVNLLTAKQQALMAVNAEQNYQQGLEMLAELKQPIDGFFEQVMVMVDDPGIRQNRLAILQQLRTLFMQSADLSLLSA